MVANFILVIIYLPNQRNQGKMGREMANHSRYPYMLMVKFIGYHFARRSSLWRY